MLRPQRYSPSSLRLYLECPRKYYYSRYTDLPKLTDYPRLCGSLVHRMIETLEKKPRASDRRYFYGTKKAMISSWHFSWTTAVQDHKANQTLLYENPDEERIFRFVGVQCLSVYWDQNLNSTPLEVEKSFTHPWTNRVPMVGIFDQIRAVPLEQIAKWRPELILEDGSLDPRFDPVIILDQKTDHHTYDAQSFKNDPSLADVIREQYDLHEGLQATIYTWLYWKTTGHFPIGFTWYHLRSGKIFFTFRDERDFVTLQEIVAHVADNEDALSFPKNVGRHCRTCDFYQPCREDRDFLVTLPQRVDETTASLERVGSKVRKKTDRQLRLKNFKSPRVPKSPPETITKKAGEVILLGAGPWEDVVGE